MAFLFRRLRLARIILAGFFVLLIIRVGYLSVCMGQTLAENSVKSHLLRLAVMYERGDIYDRNGIRITNQSESFYAAVFPDLLEDSAAMIRYLASLTEKSEAEIDKMYHLKEPFYLKLKDKAKVGSPMRGVFLFAQKNRYDSEMMAAHVLGYVKDSNRVGIGGIEAMCNDVLTGDDYQYLQVATDGTGKVIRGAPYRLSQRSKSNITVTLDWEIQQAIEAILDKHKVKGSVVVMNTDGEVLSMVSRPTFRIGGVADYLSRDDAPLVNRAVQPVALGSVFKVVTALAALESGMVTMQDTWEDAGRIEVAGITFRGWDDKEDYVSRRLTLTEAMAHSSNSVFIQIGTKIGASAIISMAKRLGIGTTTIRNYAEEREGNLPDDKNLYIAEVANLAIGQGTLLATPMQVTKMMAIVANGGYDVMPRLLKQEEMQKGTKLVDDQAIGAVQKMLAAAVDDGTGELAQSQRGQVSGKTGSAETGRKTTDGRSINHAWFSGYFPRQSPQYVCTVMIEDGNSGGRIAAPIFREIMEIIHQKKHVFPSQK